MPRAVVFAYHNVGARCLRVLRAHGIEVPLVVTHEDDPSEIQWFERVADVAEDLGIEWIAPQDGNASNEIDRIRALTPDFIFSFYYRRMLPDALLEVPPRGALNMHGSLLPKYRGRAPVNWAVLHGERRTGATLHYMTTKPDAGDIVAQQAVPILPDDTAREVFDKVTLAAEICLDDILPSLLDGSAPRLRNDLARGSYFSGRRPEDGRIDWSRSAADIHNLVRAVAPPYPGAFTKVAGRPARVLRTRVLAPSGMPTSATLRVVSGPVIKRDAHPNDTQLVASCGGGGMLRIDALEIDGQLQDAVQLRDQFGDVELPLG